MLGVTENADTADIADTASIADNADHTDNADHADENFDLRRNSRGGWMPKVAALIIAVYGQKKHEVRRLCDAYYNSSRQLQQLVDNKSYRR